MADLRLLIGQLVLAAGHGLVAQRAVDAQASLVVAPGLVIEHRFKGLVANVALSDSVEGNKHLLHGPTVLAMEEQARKQLLESGFCLFTLGRDALQQGSVELVEQRDPTLVAVAGDVSGAGAVKSRLHREGKAVGFVGRHGPYPQ